MWKMYFIFLYVCNSVWIISVVWTPGRLEVPLGIANGDPNKLTNISRGGQSTQFH